MSKTNHNSWTAIVFYNELCLECDCAKKDMVRVGKGSLGCSPVVLCEDCFTQKFLVLSHKSQLKKLEVLKEKAFTISKAALADHEKVK